MFRNCLACLMMIGLAACATAPADDGDPPTFPDTPPDPDDGADGGGSGAEDNSPPDTAFDVYSDEATILFNDIGGVFDPVRTRLANLPTTGSVAYDGVLGATLPRDGDLFLTLGELDLTVAFDGSPGTGSVTRMIDETDMTYVGTLAISGTVINTSVINDPSLAGAISGTLVDEASTSYAIEGTISADFFDGTDYVSGLVFTDVTVNDATVSTEGEFIATSLPQ